MIRTVRALSPLLLLPVLLLTGCGTEKAGAGASTPTADQAELDARAKALGIAPELVYITEVPGFTLAQQSVGVSGDDGFSASYWSQKAGAVLRLWVDRGTMTAAGCPKQPVAEAAPGDRTTCMRDGSAWYRSAGQHSEYAVPKKDHIVWIDADPRVPRTTLRKAALAAHRPSATELADLLPPAPTATPTAPVQRGDLPPNGDGAPNNDVPNEGG
ncbi:hypothetical protein AB5J56_11310 [Streptomyces sp. R21]|uniref:Lipoprotein n=1 Tax=Streptomyces sp. R21 TaxID=3238627 RepID=A0AB39P445_9ACTN